MRFNGRNPLSIIKRYGTFASRVTGVSCRDDKAKYRYTPRMGWSNVLLTKEVCTHESIMAQAEMMSTAGYTEVGYDCVDITCDQESQGMLQNPHFSWDKLKALAEDLRNSNISLGISDRCLDGDIGLYDSADSDEYYQNLVRSGVSSYRLADFGVHKSIVNALVINGIAVQNAREKNIVDISLGKCHGLAKIKHNKKTGENRVVGLDNGYGMVEYHIQVTEGGEYTLKLNVALKGGMDRLVVVEVNEDNYNLFYQSKSSEKDSYECGIDLKTGENKLVFYNPIYTKSDQAMLVADRVSRRLRDTVMKLIDREDGEYSPMSLAIDAKGKYKVSTWASNVCNEWSISKELSPDWGKIKKAYSKNIKLYKRGAVGCWGNAGVLCVGQGRLTRTQSKAQFSLWCMMNSPLMIGGDLRYLNSDQRAILLNKSLIAINQDSLCKPAKRIRSGIVDMIAKPLTGGEVAVCVFNKSGNKGFYNFPISALVADQYVSLLKAEKYTAHELWSDKTEVVTNTICGGIEGDGVRVYILKVKKD